MKIRDRVRELKDTNIEGLKAKEREFSEELFWLQIKHRSGQMTNHSSIGKLKRDIARVKTFLRTKQLEEKSRGKEEGK